MAKMEADLVRGFMNWESVVTNSLLRDERQMSEDYLSKKVGQKETLN
jgi:hypothetical protein